MNPARPQLMIVALLKGKLKEELKGKLKEKLDGKLKRELNGGAEGETEGKTELCVKLTMVAVLRDASP